MQERNTGLHHSKLELVGQNLELRKREQWSRNQLEELQLVGKCRCSCCLICLCVCQRYDQKIADLATLQSAHADLIAAHTALNKKFEILTQRSDSLEEELAEATEQKNVSDER